ncbi:MAG: hypothetical protein VR67_01710 [Peptococcaceae bacterium BRH_c8a]|nr:MAG: hypothetical protein VR67_01710 [Peptococcaceae bacterium BRH_c8a]
MAEIDSLIAPGESCRDEVLDFFGTLYGEQAPGYLVIWTKQDKRKTVFNAIDLQGAAAFAVAEFPNKDVYFGVGLQEALPEKGRGKSVTVVAILGLWFDVDIAGPNHTHLELPLDAEQARKVLGWFPLPPTLVIWTGGGLHCYWLFRKLWVLAGDDERKAAADLSRRFQRAMIAKAKEYGWKLDNTSDLARVLRIPGTLNHKGEVPASVAYLECHASEEEYFYCPEEIDRHLGQTVSARIGVDAPASGVYPPAKLGLIEEGCDWMHHCRKDAETLPYQEWFLMLGVLGRCEGGQEMAHLWSKPYPGYSVEETNAKLAEALRAGRVTCGYVEGDLGFDGCGVCPNRGRVKSPAVLGLPRLAGITLGGAREAVQTAVEGFKAATRARLSRTRRWQHWSGWRFGTRPSTRG